ncbi:hypothetical protein KCP75_17580 [Salmonella enterica subsp. enterica]|nr:hypothetical protein KCP75_17580 [Salmonella enterica subsp. enterica]
MHESTISRVTTRSICTARAVFFRTQIFLFQPSIPKASEASSTAIRALVKKLIAAENPALSH